MATLNHTGRKVLVTGAAGFIGFHLSRVLLEQDIEVVGFDSLNDYYDPSLKQDRLEILEQAANFSFVKAKLEDQEAVQATFKKHKFATVVNLAAQAGVRYSLTNPHVYVDSNITGFLNILEACRYHDVEHLIYASSSSVYGKNTSMPFTVHKNVDHPVSLYAATKKANELMAHTYSHLFQVPTTGLRFFTVYGPWGRPDMAMYLFTKAILAGEPIKVFNHGKMKRDFTYVDDIVKGIVHIMAKPAKPTEDWSSDRPDPATSSAPYRLYNIGNNKPVELLHMIEVLEQAIGKKAQLNLMDIQPGDVPTTFADISDLQRDFDFQPNTSIESGIQRFVQWYREYHKLNP